MGGVSGRPTQEALWSDPPRACDFAAVKGTLIVRMPLSFAGWRWSGGLGRLVCARNGSLPFRVSAPVTGGVPWTPRRGTIVSVRHQSHAAVRAAAHTAHSLGDTSFTRSRDPCSSIVTTSLVQTSRRWRARWGFAVGQPGQPEEPTPTPRRCGRSAARRASRLSQEGPGGASEKEGGCGLRPFEDHESPGRSARTSYAGAEVVRGGIWSRISSRAAPSKRERGASERGPSSG